MKQKIIALWIGTMAILIAVNQIEWNYYGKQTVNIIIMAIALAYSGRRFAEWMLVQLNKKREE